VNLQAPDVLFEYGPMASQVVPVVQGLVDNRTNLPISNSVGFVIDDVTTTPDSLAGMTDWPAVLTPAGGPDQPPGSPSFWRYTVPIGFFVGPPLPLGPRTLLQHVFSWSISWGQGVHVDPRCPNASGPTFVAPATP
jgi:hypothetical protein